MNKIKAKRNDMIVIEKIQYYEFQVSITLTKEVFEKLKYGKICKDFGDRWFMFYENRKLFICDFRGNLNYILSFIEDKHTCTKLSVASELINEDNKETTRAKYTEKIRDILFFNFN